MIATAASLLEAALPLALFEAMTVQRDAGVERRAAEHALADARRLLLEVEEFFAQAC